MSRLRDPGVWFLILLAVCMIGPYVFGVRPKTPRQWTLIAITIAFVAWILLPQIISIR